VLDSYLIEVDGRGIELQNLQNPPQLLIIGMGWVLFLEDRIYPLLQVMD
jgi:hypothetical protein